MEFFKAFFLYSKHDVQLPQERTLQRYCRRKGHLTGPFRGCTAGHDIWWCLANLHSWNTWSLWHRRPLPPWQSLFCGSPDMDTMCSRPPTYRGTLTPSVLMHPNPLAGSLLCLGRLLPTYPVTVDQLWFEQPRELFCHSVDCNHTFTTKSESSPWRRYCPYRFALPWVFFLSVLGDPIEFSLVLQYLFIIV